MTDLPKLLSSKEFVGLIKECFDYSDGDLFWKERPINHFSSKRGCSVFNAMYRGKKAGYQYKNTRGCETYICISVFGKNFPGHRVVWVLFNGALPSQMQIDHIDGNGLNNKIDNLRAVTQFENKKNLPLSKANKTGFIGVTWCNRQMQYVATIKDNGKHKFLGYFDLLSDAAEARKRAERLLGYHENHGRQHNG